MRNLLKSALVGLFCTSLFAETALAEKKPAQQPGFAALSIGLSDAGNVYVFGFLDEIDGLVAVCGGYFYDEKTSNNAKSLTDKILRKVFFTLDGSPLVIATSRFKRFENIEEAKSAKKFGCSKSGRSVEKVRDISSFKIKLAPGGIVD